MSAHALAPHLIPISRRPRAQPLDYLRLVVFNALFFAGCTGVLCLQLFFAAPFLLIPWEPSRKLYRRIVALSKEAFGRLLLAISSTSAFGATSFTITADSSIDLRILVERNDEGEVVGLRLVGNTVLMANHQAMRFFKFAFVSKKLPLQASPLVSSAREAIADGRPYSLLIFPEGTLFAEDTQPMSDAFALQSGVPSMHNTLLPRSTGLLFSLRNLLALTPDLTLLDVTVGYPGVPSGGYAELYYTLQTIYARRHAPPTVHLHLRALDLSTVPSLRSSHSSSSSIATTRELENDLTPTDRTAFQEYTRALWIDKDALMDRFYETGAFPAGKQTPVEVRLRMRRGDWVKLAVLPTALCATWWAAKVALWRCAGAY